MSSVSPLKALHSATTNQGAITFLKGDEVTESIKDATHVKFGNEDHPYELDTVTNFYNDDKAQNLRAVVFCWLHDKSSIVDYRRECTELGIPDFKFLVKTELTTWLNGNSDSCTFVKEEEDDNENKSLKKTSGADISTTSTSGTGSGSSSSSTKKHKLEDPQIDRISVFERESIDHNAALRGSKNIDFGYLISDAKKFISQLKRARTSGDIKKKSSGGPKKQPIIIVSPATTALLSLSNVKQFLEEGAFVEPDPSNKPTGLVTIRHKSDKLISSAQQIIVVDNVDMFNKPEYWDRVVAIFTTGQAWQFSKYKYAKPEELFQHYAGFYLSYQADPTPRQIKDWNVNEIKVDRDKRFRDTMIVRDFWTDIDKILLAKGYGKD
ncbi:accessory factor associated with RNA polymerase II [Scheffersomyces amazonensis]|uniref:accessory factor associated with RNA polymerase II n=1 Tax=Scheffersomyces amazonensis TaxID=1078765 RepID=UPI00315C8FDD